MIFAPKVPQHIVKQALEHQGGTKEDIRHDAVLIVARGRANGCFPLTTLSDTHKIMGIVQV